MSDKLRLSNQICFPFYAISRKITKMYTPFLKELNLTYPKYLVMLILWEKDGVLIKDICNKLSLETNTLSPILKTLEKDGLILKKKRAWNDKETFVFLSEKWKKMKEKAKKIPEKLMKNYHFKWIDLAVLHKTLWQFMSELEKNNI